MRGIPRNKRLKASRRLCDGDLAEISPMDDTLNEALHAVVKVAFGISRRRRS